MAGLKVEANLENTIENIVALREEIDRLKKSLIEVAGVPNSDKAVKKLEAQLQKAMKSLREYQSKYSQLKKAYDDVIGSEETIKKVHEETKGLQSTNQWIVANTKAVKEADAEIKKLKNNFKGLTDEEKTGEKGYGILRQVEYQVAVRKKEEEAIRRTIKAQKEQIIQSESEEGSITSLRKQLNQLIITYDNIGRANRNGGVGKDLLTQIKAVQTELNAAEQATGRFQRNVGNYSSAFNGLGMSIQQIARELPSATMGINMFFLAISNNLPIFFDEVQKARKEYAAYLAELSKGNKDIQKVAPVWKQLAAGIFSWNTALVVGITLLTAYGKEIFDYIGGLFGATEEQKRLNESLKDFNTISRRAITESRLLFEEIEKTKEGTKGRLDAIKKINEEYGKYIPHLLTEKSSLMELESAYNLVNKALLENAVLKAKSSAIDKVLDKSIKEQAEALTQISNLANKGVGINNAPKVLNVVTEWTEEFREAGMSWQKTFNSISENIQKQFGKMPKGFYSELENYIKSVYDANKEIDKIQQTYNPLFNKKEADKAIVYNEEYLRTQREILEKELKALSYTEAKGEKGDLLKQEIAKLDQMLAAYSTTNKYNEIINKNEKILSLETKYAIERQRQQQDLDNQLEQSRIDSLQDGYEKEQAQRELNNKKEIQALERQKEDYIRAYIQGQKEIFDAQEELKAKQTKGYVKKSFSSSSISVDTSIFDSIIGNTRKRQYSDEIREQEASWNEYLVKFGNYQQKRKAIIDKYDQAIKEASNAGDEGMLEEEKRQQLNNLDEQYGKTTRAMADLFEDASNKSVSAIQSIIDKYETLVKYMSGTKESDGTNVTLDELKALGFTDKDIEKIEKGEISIKDVTDAIRGLKDELKGKSPWQAFVSDLEKGIESIKKGGNDSKKIGQGITDIGNAVTSFAPALNEFGTDIANIFGIDDSKITGAIEALGGLGQTAAGVGQIMSGDIVGGAMSAVSGISTVVSALDGMFGADYSRYNEMVEEYNKLNEIWDELIDKKREYIDMSYGVEADKVGQEAIDLVEKQIEAYRTLGKERLNSGASVGSHSIGKRMAKNTSSSDWQYIADALDMSVNAAKEFIGTGRMTGLFDLTVEQLEKLKSDAPTFWADMDDDVREYLDSIIEGEAKIEEIQNQVKEQLTQTTFDSVFDSFVDTLMDMDSSAKDFAEDFSEYMQRAILTNMVGEKFSKELQDWYDSFAEAGKDKEGITKGDMEELRKQYEEIVDAAVAERDKLAEIFGWTGEATQQSASSRGFQSMSQDTGEELNGRFTALQIAGEEIKNQNIAQSQSLSILNTRIDTISSTSSNIRDIASETRDIIARSYLELVQISENTGAIVKPVQQMQKDIAEVKKNTSKL
jgi:DNA repair exonuclease SbcCD ATPase subunit|nr:MAG TPA: tail tape measure protein [Caudoviricetes sp.]